MRDGKYSIQISRASKAATRFCHTLGLHLLICSLVILSLVPAELWADVPAPPRNSYASGSKSDGTDDPRIFDLLEELFGENKKSDRPGHIPLSSGIANRGFILYQELVLMADDGLARERWSLSQLDVGLSDVNPSLESLHTDLRIHIVPGGVQFQLKGIEHRHSVYFRDGRSLIHWVESRNAYYFLMDDGTVLATPKDYFTAIYSGPIPMHIVAQVQKKQGMKLHVIHRVNPNDPHLIEMKDPSQYEEELQRGRPVPISAEIVDAWESAHPDRPFPYEEGDLAVIMDRGNGEEIVDIISRISITDQLDLHTNVDYLLMALLSPDRILFEKEAMRTRTQGRQAVLDLAKNDRRVQALIMSGYSDALNRMDADSIEQGRTQTEQMLRLHAREMAAGTEGRLRDRFTYDEMAAAHQGLIEARAKHQKENENKKAQGTLRAAWSSVVEGISKQWSRMDFCGNLKRVALVLGKAAGVVGLGMGIDQIWTDGAYTHLAIETVTQLMGIAQNSLPITGADPNYLWWDLPKAVGTLMLLFGGLLATASGLARWSREPLSQAAFCVRHGIRLFSKLLVGVRGVARVTGRPEAHKAMQEGYLKMLMPGTGLRRQAQVDQANEEIRVDQRLQSLATMIALAAAGTNAEIDPGLLAASAAGHDLNTDEGLRAAMETSQLIYFELSQSSKEELDSLMSGNYELFAEAYSKWVKRAQAMRNPADSPRIWHKWMAWARSTASIRFLKGLSHWGEDIEQKLSEAKPNEIISRLVHRGTVISFLITTLITSVAGGFANPQEVEKLFAQPDAFLGINPMVLVNSMETIVFSMTVAAATTFLAFYQRSTPILESYRPQVEHLVSNKPHTRTVLREYWELLRHLFDFRNSQPMRFASLTNYFKRVVFFLPCLVLGVLPRVIGAATEGNFEEGFLKTLIESPAQGELTAWALAMTFYAFVYCFILPAQEGLEVKTKRMRDEYHAVVAGLDQAVRLNDGSLRASVNNMLALYGAENRSTQAMKLPRFRRQNVVRRARDVLAFSRSYPPIADNFEILEEAWADLENVENADTETKKRVRATKAINNMKALYRKHGGLPGEGKVTTELEYAIRLLDFAGQEPPVPTSHREGVAQVNMIGIGAAAAVLASYMYPHTYLERGWTAINWSDWNLWFHDPGDGVVGLLMKMCVYTFAFLLGQNVFNAFWDNWIAAPWYNFATRYLGFERDLAREAQIERRSRESSQALQSVLGVNLIQSLARNLVGFAFDAGESVKEGCVNLLGKAAKLFQRSNPPAKPE